MCKKYGVNIHLNTEVDKELLKKLDVDIVVLATGAKPAMPPIPGLAGCSIKATTTEVLRNKPPAGQKVVIAGGGFMAAELAEFLLEHGKEVTMVEMRGEIAADADVTAKPGIRETLAATDSKHQILPVSFTPMVNTTIKRFTTDGAVVEKNGEEITLSRFDTVVVAIGMKSYNPLEETARKYFKAVRVISDAKEPELPAPWHW